MIGRTKNIIKYFFQFFFVLCLCLGDFQFFQLTIDYKKPGTPMDPEDLFTFEGSKQHVFEFWSAITFISTCHAALEYRKNDDPEDISGFAGYKQLLYIWRNRFVGTEFYDGLCFFLPMTQNSLFQV